MTIAPATHTIGNCYPFGGGIDPDPTVSWPYMGFVYKNVPAFQLKTGDTLAFDLGAMNTGADIQLEIALAATTLNGGDVPSQPFTTVVTNTQTPANPRGDTTVGNFELSFIAQAPFSFPGGGLIIRFSNPSASYAAGNTCDAVLVRTTSADPSNNFVERFFSDVDGAFPWENVQHTSIGGFRVTPADIPPAPTTKRKCKKHKKHHAASAKKKHCKKKK